MNKFLLAYIIFVVIWFLDICYELIKPSIKKLWTKFWVSRGRCPKCFRTFWNYNDYGFDYGYCQKHIEEKYYEDKTKVREEI